MTVHVKKTVSNMIVYPLLKLFIWKKFLHQQDQFKYLPYLENKVFQVKVDEFLFRRCNNLPIQICSSRSRRTNTTFQLLLPSSNSRLCRIFSKTTTSTKVAFPFCVSTLAISTEMCVEATLHNYRLLSLPPSFSSSF